MKDFFSKYFSLIISAKKRNDLKKEKELDKLIELEKLSDRTLTLEKNELISIESSKRWILTGIYGVFYVSLVGLLSTIAFMYVKQYMQLSFTSNVSMDNLATAKLATIIIAGSAIIIIFALTVALFLFLNGQQKRKNLILLYEYEEKRKKENHHES